MCGVAFVGLVEVYLHLKGIFVSWMMAKQNVLVAGFYIDEK